MSRGVVSVVMALSALAFGAAQAAPAPAPAAPAEDPAQQAKSLYVQGDRAFNLGHYEDALALFEKAYNTKPVVGLLYNVATCHRFLGNLEQARRVYRAFINQTGDSKLKAVAQEKLAEVEGVLEAQAKSRVSGPSTLAPLDKAGGATEPGAAPSLVPPPPPKIIAVPVPETPAEKKAPAPKIVAVGKPAPAPTSSVQPSPAPAPPVRAQPSAPSSHLLFWSGLGVGVASAGAGAFFGMQSKSASDTLAKGGLTRSAADEQVSTMQRDATLGNVLLIGGVVVLGAAAVAWFTEAP